MIDITFFTSFTSLFRLCIYAYFYYTTVFRIRQFHLTFIGLIDLTFYSACIILNERGEAAFYIITNESMTLSRKTILSRGKPRSKSTEAYRSGHNEAVLKTVWVKAHGGSNPSASANAKRTPRGVRFALKKKEGFEWAEKETAKLFPAPA